MNLADFVEQRKVENSYGDPSDTSYTDQASENIIRALNDCMRRFWRKFPWDWSVTAISQSVGADSPDVTFGSTIGQILLLGIQGERGYLRPMSFKYYLEWKKTKADETGSVTHYIRTGRTSNNLQIKLWRRNQSAFTLEGWGKTRLTTYSTSDIAANTGIAYFPEEVHDILGIGVDARIQKIMGKAGEFSQLDSKFEKMIEEIIGEEQTNKPDDDSTTPAPGYFKRRWKFRGKGTLVV